MNYRATRMSLTEPLRRLYGSDGPLWYRGWALDDEDKVCAAVDAVLQKTGTRRMIMGHTPDFEKIVSRCGGKIIIIDTGECTHDARIACSTKFQASLMHTAALCRRSLSHTL
jgi:hypothetical protein